MTTPQVAPDDAPDAPDAPDEQTPDDPGLGGLTVEDDPEGTVDPSELAGSADGDDEDVS